MFEAVQSRKIFPDSKIFVDAVPQRDPAEIVADYLGRIQEFQTDGALKRFVEENFVLPEAGAADLALHLEALWGLLSRSADQPPRPGSTLLPLPHPYVVPGGRFREIYYWDSYFTMLGLIESGRAEMAGHMVENFAHMIRTHGFVPNGNRTYYLSRSQPPYFSLMVGLLAEREGPAVCRRYLTELRSEHSYWMDAAGPTRHLVRLPCGQALNRYYDSLDTPRPEAFAEDMAVAARSGRDRNAVFRHIRAAAESGWDFSSRWLADGRNLETIETVEIIPVDLNCLLWNLERMIGEIGAEAGMAELKEHYGRLAAERQAAVLQRFWSEDLGFFCDYNLRTGEPNPGLNLAGATPLFFRLATEAQAAKVAEVLERSFLREGGLVTTLAATTHQWDAPNGWAPLHWITIQGLERYGHRDLARRIARRWIQLNRDVFGRTGRFMEKYNVVDPAGRAEGGEYSVQAGFGWTNAVLLKLIRQYP